MRDGILVHKCEGRRTKDACSVDSALFLPGVAATYPTIDSEEEICKKKHIMSPTSTPFVAQWGIVGCGCESTCAKLACSPSLWPPSPDIPAPSSPCRCQCDCSPKLAKHSASKLDTGTATPRTAPATTH